MVPHKRNSIVWPHLVTIEKTIKYPTCAMCTVCMRCVCVCVRGRGGIRISQKTHWQLKCSGFIFCGGGGGGAPGRHWPTLEAQIPKASLATPLFLTCARWDSEVFLFRSWQNLFAAENIYKDLQRYQKYSNSKQIINQLALGIRDLFSEGALWWHF